MISTDNNINIRQGEIRNVAATLSSAATITVSSSTWQIVDVTGAVVLSGNGSIPSAGLSVSSTAMINSSTLTAGAVYYLIFTITLSSGNIYEPVAQLIVEAI